MSGWLGKVDGPSGSTTGPRTDGPEPWHDRGIFSIGQEPFKLAMPLEMRPVAFGPSGRQEQLAGVNVTPVHMDTVGGPFSLDFNRNGG